MNEAQQFLCTNEGSSKCNNVAPFIDRIASLDPTCMWHPSAFVYAIMGNIAVINSMANTQYNDPSNGACSPHNPNALLLLCTLAHSVPLSIGAVMRLVTVRKSQ